MQTSQICALASGLAYTLAYLDYNREVLKGKTKPNGATWLIWSSISLISTASYFKATGDAWKSVIPFLNIGLCIMTFVLAAYLKKFKWPDKMDVIALAIGVLAAIVWKQYESAKYANVVVQFAVLAGFYPTWRSILKDPTCEQSRPWWIWSTGYVLAFIVVILRWNGQWIDILYPINAIMLHASVPIVSLLQTRALTSK